MTEEQLQEEIGRLNAKCQDLQTLLSDLWMWLSEQHAKSGHSKSKYLTVIEQLQNNQSVIEGGLFRMIQDARKSIAKFDELKKELDDAKHQVNRLKLYKVFRQRLPYKANRKKRRGRI